MSERHALNPIDDLIALFDDAVRAGGQPGFNCVAVVAVGARLDLDRLARAADRLVHRHPLATARLRRRLWAWRPRWVTRPDGSIPVDVSGDREADSRSDSSEAGCGAAAEGPPVTLAGFAAEALNRPLDPRVDPPVRVLVRRGRAGGDLVALQWSHVLADARGGDFLMGELGRCYGEDGGEPVLPASPRPGRLSRPATAPRWPMRAAERVGVFEPFDGVPTGPMRVRIAVLDAAESERLRRDAARVAGFGRQALFVLAAYLRAMSREACRRGHPDTLVRTQWPVSLRDGTPPGALPANEYGLLPIEHRASEDVDLAALVDRLTRQTVAALGAGTHWQLWQTGRWLRTTFFPALCMVNRWTRFLLRGSCLTTHFRYAGRLLAGARSWGGLPVEGGCVGTLCYPESPVAVGFSETAGRFHIGVTWLDGAITEETAERLIETLRAELGGAAPAADAGDGS